MVRNLSGLVVVVVVVVVVVLVLVVHARTMPLTFATRSLLRTNARLFVVVHIDSEPQPSLLRRSNHPTLHKFTLDCLTVALPC